LEYLKRYGAAAKEVVPQLKEKIVHFKQIDDNDTAKIVEAAIVEIEASTETPTLISLQEFINQSSASGGAANDTKDAK
jgi:hydrogenase maturation factor HypE